MEIPYFKKSDLAQAWNDINFHANNTNGDTDSKPAFQQLTIVLNDLQTRIQSIENSNKNTRLNMERSTELQHAIGIIGLLLMGSIIVLATAVKILT